MTPLFLLAAPAWAEGTQSQTFVPKPLAGHAVLELRVGLLAADPTTHPFLCGELSPVDRISIEGCGTGAGFLHQADEPDLAHFRVRGVAVRGGSGRLQGEAGGGVGFAEIQTTSDAPGFKFGEAESDDQIEAAGGEASLSARGKLWIHPRSYLSVDVSAGAAYIPAAPTVMGGGGPVVPFANVTAGFGF